MDKISFLSAQELELTRNLDSNWVIVSYEFNFSCNGDILMKSYMGNKIPREISNMVKRCDKTAVADFRRIMVKSNKDGKIYQLNDIMITVE
jgi:hypothetical protein